MKLTLQEIAILVDGSINGNHSKEISGLNSLENANLNQISYAVSLKYKDALLTQKRVQLLLMRNLKSTVIQMQLLLIMHI